MSTGERIRQRRKELSISAETLAYRLQVSPATVYRWEKGDIEKVPATILGPLSEILQTTAEYLMEWTDDPDVNAPKKMTQAYIPQTEEARILAKGFDRMPEADRKRAIDMAKLIFAAYADLFEKGNDDDES